MKAQEVIRCDRCHREINEFWGVIGFGGKYADKTFGRQCALQICQGNEQLLKSKVIPIKPEDMDFEIPF